MYPLQQEPDFIGKKRDNQRDASDVRRGYFACDIVCALDGCRTFLSALTQNHFLHGIFLCVLRDYSGVENINKDNPEYLSVPADNRLGAVLYREAGVIAGRGIGYAANQDS